MKAYLQQVLSAPAKLSVGQKMMKDGTIKKIYKKNPLSHQIKAIKHAAVQNHDVPVEK